MGNYKNYSSYFFEEKGMFGGFPNQEQVGELIELGVRYFVDLTFPNEVQKYILPENCFYINYSIQDRYVPENVTSFTSLVLLVYDTILTGGKIYIHCKGGHGRSGILVASLLTLLNSVDVEQAIQQTTISHSKRLVMRDKWRKIGSPQTYYQRKFVHKFFNDLVFFRSYRSGGTVGLSNYSYHTVTVIDSSNSFLPTGVFPTSEALFQASKNLTDKRYIQRQIQAKSPKISKQIAQKIIPDENWENNKEYIMKSILKLKFDQHPWIKENLTKTGLRTIIYNSRRDSFFGVGPLQNGQNILGKILKEIREEYQRALPIKWV